MPGEVVPPSFNSAGESRKTCGAISQLWLHQKVAAVSSVYSSVLEWLYPDSHSNFSPYSFPFNNFIYSSVPEQGKTKNKWGMNSVFLNREDIKTK